LSKSDVNLSICSYKGYACFRGFTACDDVGDVHAIRDLFIQQPGQEQTPQPSFPSLKTFQVIRPCFGAY
jgi:hypothetical protein